MSLYHFSVKQVLRGKGQTVVGSAAYISGQKLHNDYYEEIHDYTRKQGVIYDEIMLPDYVPDRFSDRQTLWNERSMPDTINSILYNRYLLLIIFLFCLLCQAPMCLCSCGK